MMRNIVNDYFNKELFCFLPNICNSSCRFCYVQPLKGKLAKLSREFLVNFETLCVQANEIGFDVFRITGGEPLIFSNFNVLLEIMEKYKISYTILTNGQLLRNNIDIISAYKPKKLTFSFHSINRYFDIFGNSIELDEFTHSLKAINMDSVCCTILCLEENFNEINNVVKYFISHDITDFKIICPNNYSNISFEDYINKISTANGVRIRVTNLYEKNCLLLNRGFLSISVENLRAYNCCVNIGMYQHATCYEGNFKLEKVVLDQYINNLKIRKIPCKTNLNCCPIALRDLS